MEKAFGPFAGAISSQRNRPSEGGHWTTSTVFFAHYARARDLGADAIADEILEISDDRSNDWMDRSLPDGSVKREPDHEHINRSRLRVDTRKWLLAKMAPKRYGDRTVTTLVGPDDGPVQLEAVRSKLTQRLDAIAQGFEEAASVEVLKALEGPK
jgi:hypothetical protein